MRRTIPFLVAVLAMVAMAATTPNKSIYKNYHFYLNGRWVNGDSGDVVTFYPAEEDTTGQGINLTWIGGSQYVWRFTVPDSSEVWEAYETHGADSSLSLAAELIWSHVAPESSIVTRSVRDSQITGRKVAYKTLNSDNYGDASVTPEKLTFGASGGGAFSFKDSPLDSVAFQTISVDSIIGSGSPTTWITGGFNVVSGASWYFGNTPEFGNGATITTGTLSVASSSALSAEGNTTLGNGMGDYTKMVGDSVSVQTTDFMLRSRLNLFSDLYVDSLDANAYTDTVPWPGAVPGQTEAWVVWHPTWYEVQNTFGALAADKQPVAAVGYNGDTLFVTCVTTIPTVRPYMMWVFERK